MQRTKDWRRHQDQKHINKWIRYRDTFISPEYWDDYWTQRNRFLKYSLSCKCSICSATRASRKYKRDKNFKVETIDK